MTIVGAHPERGGSSTVGSGPDPGGSAAPTNRDWHVDWSSRAGLNSGE